MLLQKWPQRQKLPEPWPRLPCQALGSPPLPALVLLGKKIARGREGSGEFDSFILATGSMSCSVGKLLIGVRYPGVKRRLIGTPLKWITTEMQSTRG